MRGVVAAGHELTARAGVEMLEQGGNAFDAAVAAVFASSVCEPVLTSLGGGGFLLARTAGGRTMLYDFFPDVPGRGAETDKDSLDFFSVYIDFADVRQGLHVGRASAAVPGVAAGLARVHADHCLLSLKTLLAPAVAYARDGIELNAWQAYFIDLLSPMLKASEETMRVFAPGGRLPGAGETVFNKDMADTFEYLSDKGLESFYEAELAGRIVEGFSPGAGGLITERDLESYRVMEREPLRVCYRGREVLTNPPPSSGGCLIAFALRLLEGFDVAALGHNTASGLLLLSEIMGLVDEARREEFDGRLYDPALAHEFLSDEQVARYSARAGRTGRRGPGLNEGTGPGNTTQISVVDDAGNAASVTTSCGIGCGFVIPGTGIMMNNMLGEEDLNRAGFHRQAPGTRISSMMAPTVVMKDDQPEVVLGSGGSKRIRSAILQVILNVVDHGLDIDSAVNSARAHLEGGIFHVEKGVEPAVMDALEAEGLSLKRWKETNVFFGGVHAASGTLEGAGDGRRGGVAITCAPSKGCTEQG